MARLFDDASSESLTLGTALWPDIPFAACFWGYSDDADSRQTGISLGNSSNAQPFFLLGFAGNQTTPVADPIEYTMRETDSSPIIEFYTSSGYSVNTWHHAACVSVANDDHAVFIDGGGKGTDSSAFEIPTNIDLNQTAIGSLYRTSQALYFSGRIAEAAIWDLSGWGSASDWENKALPALAAGYSPLHFPLGLTMYLPLIRDNDINLVGSGDSFTANNTPTIAAHPPVIYPAQVYQSFAAAAAPPVGLSIPVAMHHYRQQGMSY